VTVFILFLFPPKSEYCQRPCSVYISTFSFPAWKPAFSSTVVGIVKRVLIFCSLTQPGAGAQQKQKQLSAEKADCFHQAGAKECWKRCPARKAPIP